MIYLNVKPPPRVQHDSSQGRLMSDRILFSMGGVSILFALMALAMIYPV